MVSHEASLKREERERLYVAMVVQDEMTPQPDASAWPPVNTGKLDTNTGIVYTEHWR